MRVRRVKNRIIDLMREEGEMTTKEIYFVMNLVTHHGITMNQLGNVLAKGREFEKVGFVNNTQSGERHRCIVWRLSNDSNVL